MLLLDVSTLQGCELHLDVFRLLVACAAAGLVYTTEVCAASRHVYTLRPELYLDMSNPHYTGTSAYLLSNVLAWLQK